MAIPAACHRQSGKFLYIARMLHLNDVTLRIGGRLLLEGATVHLPAGQRIGLVGRNGAGKSTLLKVIRGELQPDRGDVKKRSRINIGWVAQEAPGGEATPHETVLAADVRRADTMLAAERAETPEEIAEAQTRLADIGAHAAPARASTILRGLGFDEPAQHQPLSSYSGGWRMRVALAAALFAEPDLLLLDEPTNHLDLEATLWLESYLRRYPHTLLLVSHDRDLLNRVPERIIHLEALKLTAYGGGYDDFERIRREKQVLAEKERAKVEAKRKHMQAFVDRFRYKASKARQAQSRLKALSKLDPVSQILDEPGIRLAFPEAEVPPPPLLTFDRVQAGYGEKVVLDRLDLRIDPDDRIALLGANGNGKSTFAKLIAGRLSPMAGEIVHPPKLEVGYFAQHQIEDLDPGHNALDHLARLLPNERPERLRAHLGRFGLGQERAELRVSLLSGGEKARLTFALLSAGKPQILVLDEPTNHLDIDSREALVQAINDFAGAVILISHDRHLIELTADRLWLVAEGRVKPYEGDLDDYRRLLLGGARAETSASHNRHRGRSGQTEAPPSRARKPADRSEVLKRRQVARAAEKELERLSTERATVAATLADEKTYRSLGDELDGLLKRHAELEAAVELAEMRWLEAEEALEAVERQ
ncbi:MAG: ABC-F family ATP-binding cassette domain-containing protein [Pseudomonadota bacterium]